MPTLEKTERVSSFHQKLTFTLADLNLLDPNLKFSASFEPALRGRWLLTIEHATENAKVGIKIIFNWLELGVGALGENVQVSYNFARVTAQGELGVIASGYWELFLQLPNSLTSGAYAFVSNVDLEAKAKASGGTFDLKTQRRYSIELDLRSTALPDPAELAKARSGSSSISSRDATKLNSRNSGTELLASPLPSNIRFYFAPAGRTFELWTRLSSLPPRLVGKISFAQFVAPPRTGLNTRNAPPPSIPAASISYESDPAYPDSDSEEDSIYSRILPAVAKQANDLPTPNNFRQVNLKGIKYSTFKALLVYLDSGFIEFSPLTSAFPLTSPPFPTRKAYLEKQLVDHPKLPLPVSPKSMYRLASLLDVSPLKTLSLSSLKSSLTLSNAAQELFSPLSISHEEVQAAIIEYVASNWAAIREGESYKEIVKRIKRDEIKGAGKVLVDLIVAVQGK